MHMHRVLTSDTKEDTDHYSTFCRVNGVSLPITDLRHAS